MTNQHLVVIFREGGPERCRWRRVLGSFGSYGDADKKIDELRLAGYRALARNAQSLRLAGLPIGWTFDLWRKQVDTHEIDAHGWWTRKPKTT